MGRKPMLEYSGGVYHLIQRGNNREYIFNRNEDKEYFLELIREVQSIMGFECYGFVIMGNHYHLIFKRNEVPIRSIMHRINSHFSRYYNQKNKRTGHVFENRYKGYYVQDDRYLLSLLRYVHQNPVVAKICGRVCDYLWSSDQYYRNNNDLSLVNINFVLGIFSEDRSKAIPAYCEFMDASKLEIPTDFEVPSRSEIQNETAKANLLLKPVNSPDQKNSQRSLAMLLKEVTGNDEIYQAIRSGSRKRTLSVFKKKFIAMAISENYTMREIGDFISVTEVAIYKMSIKN
ncbi:MAG: transposase [Acetobacterium sp.]|nr:transposase [Acetobacterium sp.]